MAGGDEVREGPGVVLVSEGVAVVAAKGEMVGGVRLGVTVGVNYFGGSVESGAHSWSGIPGRGSPQTPAIRGLLP